MCATDHQVDTPGMDSIGLIAIALSALVILDLAAPHLGGSDRTRRSRRRPATRR